MLLQQPAAAARLLVVVIIVDVEVFLVIPYDCPPPTLPKISRTKIIEILEENFYYKCMKNVF